MVKRDETKYEIEAASKTLNVLMALEGTNFEPVTVHKVIERTGYSRDFCDRALATLLINGFAVKTDGKKWMLGNKLLRFSERYNETVMSVLSK